MEEAWSQAEEELSQLGIKSTCEEQLKTAEGMETDPVMSWWKRSTGLPKNLRNWLLEIRS